MWKKHILRKSFKINSSQNFPEAWAFMKTDGDNLWWLGRKKVRSVLITRRERNEEMIFSYILWNFHKITSGIYCDRNLHFNETIAFSPLHYFFKITKEKFNINDIFQIIPKLLGPHFTSFIVANKLTSSLLSSLLFRREF